MDIKKIIRASGMHPFLSTYRCDKNDEAHEMMGGKSHFYDADTMRFFACRVAWCDDVADGAAMVAVMSQKRGFTDNRREWKFAIHDFAGHTIADGTFSTRASADKAARDAITALDSLAIVRNVFQRKRESIRAESKSLAKAARMLPRKRKCGAQRTPTEIP